MTYQDRPDRRGLRVPVAFTWLLLIAATSLAVAVVLTRADPSGSDDAPDGLIRRIAVDPEAHDGRRVRLTGSVAAPPTSLPEGTEDAFVLGDGNARILVLWESPRLDDLVPGASVEVSGTVRAPEAVADERYPEEPPVTRTELLGRTGARAIVEAERVAPTG